MATNPYVNKVQYGNDTLIDLTNDTATEATVLEGYTFHGADGQIRTGTAVAGGGDDKMDIDGTNADTSVTFPNSAFTVGSRASSFDMGVVENWTTSIAPRLTINFIGCSAVAYDNKIHILGSSNSSNYKYHYSWDGTSWKSESTLPYNFYYGSAVVYNNKIHILGGNGLRTHYSWNGTSWTQESTLPYVFYYGSAVVYNNKIHILGNDKKHYSWNGNSWVSESTLPYALYQGSAVVYNNKIHILGSGNSDDCTKHYSWDGTSWVEESTLPYPFYNSSAVIYHNEIHILGSGDSSNYKKHYSWNGISWTELLDTDSNSAYNRSVVLGDLPSANPKDRIYVMAIYSSYVMTGGYYSNYEIITIAEPEKPGTFVQGTQSMAAGNYSYARGYNCLAAGDYSKAEGVNAYAPSDFQSVFKGSTNKFDTEEFAAGRSLYNNVISSSLTDQTAIDGRYGCSGTTITTSYIYLEIDPFGVYLLFTATLHDTAPHVNSVTLISNNRITYFGQNGSTSSTLNVQYYNNSLFNIIYFSLPKAQFTLIRLI